MILELALIGYQVFFTCLVVFLAVALVDSFQRYPPRGKHQVPEWVKGAAGFSAVLGMVAALIATILMIWA